MPSSPPAKINGTRIVIQQYIYNLSASLNLFSFKYIMPSTAGKIFIADANAIKTKAVSRFIELFDSLNFKAVNVNGIVYNITGRPETPPHHNGKTSDG